MTNYNSFLLCVSIISTFVSAEEPIPEFLHICHSTNPQLEQCMKNSVENLRPYFIDGIPSINLPSIEPIDLGELVISEKSRNNGLTMVVKNLKAYGPSQFVIKKISVIKYGEVYDFDMMFPKITSTGKYFVDGQIILLPIKGSGDFVGNFSNIFVNVKMTFDRKADTDNVLVKKMEIKAKVGKGTIKIGNMFNGDRVLTETVNEVINQNFESLSQEFVPLIERALQKTCTKLANKICKRYTYEQLFPI